MPRFFILILLIFVAQQASAQAFRGRWLCSDCEISGATGVAIGAAFDMVAFISGTIIPLVGGGFLQAKPAYAGYSRSSQA